VSAPPMQLPPLDGLAAEASARALARPELSSARIQRNGTLSGITRPVPSAPSNALPPSVSVPDLVRDVRDESSASLPVYTGTSRRSTIVAGVLVFAVATIAGFWGVRSVLSLWGNDAPVDAPIHADEAAQLAPAASPKDFAAVEPARDPTAAAALEPRASATPTPAASATPAATPSATPAPSAEAREKRLTRAEARAEAARERALARAEAKASASPKASAEPKVTAEPKSTPEPKATVAPKTTPEPRPTPEPKSTPEPKATAEAKASPEPTKPAAGGRLGIVTLSASVEVTVEHDGRSVGSSPSSLMIRGESGTVTLSGASIPYTVKLSYRVVDGELSVKVDTSPWSIVKHNGISLGKTPQEPSAGKRHKFSLVKPGQAEPLDVSLLWNPTSK